MKDEIIPIGKEEIEKMTDGFLIREDNDYIKKIGNDLIERMSILQQFRPKYLMEVSVLKDTRFPTPDSKYWQCVLERNVHFTNLCMLHFNYMEKLADIELKEALIAEKEVWKEKTAINVARIKKLRIQVARMKAEARLMQKEAKERVREVRCWTELIDELKPHLKYDKDNPEAHMPESYMIRFAEEKKMIEEIGASDMSGAMNIIGIGKTAARKWKELNK